MQARPRLKIMLTLTDKIMEIAGWVAVIVMWLLIIKQYSSLPDSIPIHYNIAGEADKWGGKATIFVLPAIATVLFIALTILNRFPHIFNYPKKITAGNAQQQYQIATRLIRYVKLVLVLVLSLLVFKTIQNAQGQATGLGVWFIPLSIGVLLVPLVFFIRSSLKVK